MPAKNPSSGASKASGGPTRASAKKQVSSTAPPAKAAAEAPKAPTAKPGAKAPKKAAT